MPRKLPVKALDPPIKKPIDPVIPTKIVPLENPMISENLSGRSESEIDQMINGASIQTVATPNAPAINASKADPLYQAETPQIRIIMI